LFTLINRLVKEEKNSKPNYLIKITKEEKQKSHSSVISVISVICRKTAWRGNHNEAAHVNQIK